MLIDAALSDSSTKIQSCKLDADPYQDSINYDFNEVTMMTRRSNGMNKGIL